MISTYSGNFFLRAVVTAGTCGGLIAPSETEVSKSQRKFLVPIFAVLLVGVAVPLSLPRAHGDDTNETLNITGLLARDTYDSYLGSYVDAVQAGNTLTFNVIFNANSYVYQRNLTV